MVSLTEESMRILWPLESATSSATLSSTSLNSTSVNLSGAEEFEIAIPPMTRGPFNSRYFRWKFIAGGAAKIRAPLLNNGASARNQFGIGARGQTNKEAAIVAKFEREMVAGITTEMSLELSSNNYEQVSQKIASGNWRGAVIDLFNMKIKRCFTWTQNGATNIEFEPDITADEHLCFFGATFKVKVALPLSRIPRLSLPSGYRVEFETTIAIRFNLTEAAWAKIAQRLGGGPMLRAATQQITNLAARQAIRSALMASGIFAVAVVGALGILYVSAELCNAARARGHRWGLLLGYCTGYLEKIRQLHDAELRTLARATTDRFNDGWNDATRAISISSLQSVEQTLIYHFASDYECDTLGTLYNIATFNPECDVEEAHSRIGNFIDEEHEVTSIALSMSRYLAENIEEVEAYLSNARTSGFIQSANQRSRRR